MCLPRIYSCAALATSSMCWRRDCISSPAPLCNAYMMGLLFLSSFQLTISAGVKGNVVGRSLARYMLSYDVWEEKFKVVRLGNFGKFGAHLSATAAEAWCLQNTFLSVGSLPTDKPLWARLEVRSVETRELPRALPTRESA